MGYESLIFFKIPIGEAIYWETITISTIKKNDVIKGHRLNILAYEKQSDAFEFSHFVLFGAPLVLPPHIYLLEVIYQNKIK